MRWVYHLIASVLLLIVTSQTAMAQQIRVLVVANTGDGGMGRQATIEQVEFLFQTLVPADRYVITVMESAKQNYGAESVLRMIRNVRVSPDDTFVFLFHGHGGRDKRSFLGRERHFLAMPDGGRLWSADLQDTVDSKPCHLRLILTASCNTSVRMAMAAALDSDWDVASRGMAPIMQRLFVDHRGLLHMNGSYPGQFHFSDAGGAWFLRELFWHLLSNPTDRPTWETIDGILDKRMDRIFQNAKESPWFPEEARNQKTLHPVAWSYPRPGDLGGQPKVLSLEPGDIILTINGERIRGRADCITAVNQSPSFMTFTVRDRRDGTVWRLQTQLQSSGYRFGVNLKDNPNGGAYVTSVNAGYPATRNQVLGRE